MTFITTLPRRKTEGVFYTPAFVTKYIVDQTLGRIFNERWNDVLTELETFEALELYRERIKSIRVLDLSCGVGAFLLAAFDALVSEYERVNAKIAALTGEQPPPFDLTKTILDNNLFGVDINAESVDMTKLALLLKTANQGRKLTSVDNNIRWGNSIVADPSVDPLAFDWEAGAWKEGFDVVIGNPPYVRQELLTKFKAHLASTYRTHHGQADLYVYFFERGISVLKPGGRLGYMVANKWLRGGYAGPLREYLAKETKLETIVDFGHAPIFPDADAFPSIVTLKKSVTEQTHDVHVTTFPRQKLETTAIADYIEQHRHAVPQSRFSAASWSLESPALEALMAKVRAKGVTLAQFAKVKPYRGLLTGLNEAFVIDTETRNRLVAKDDRAAELVKKYLRGQDIDRWAPEWSGLWLIAIPSSSDRDLPWKDFSEAEAERKFCETFPSIHAHLKRFENALRKRKDQGRYWWELRSCAYYDAFSRPKIFYPDITWRGSFCIDETGFFTSNTVYFLPTNDAWIAAVLNSPLMWSYCWRGASHAKDEALRLFTDFMINLPMASPSEKQRAEAEMLVHQLVPMRARKADALVLERRLSALVNEAYGMTAEDEALLWDTAPPRMPFDRA